MSKERYIEAKQRWAEKQKARGVTARALASQDRLPPGQKLTEGFPVLDLGVQPDIPHEGVRMAHERLHDLPEPWVGRLVEGGDDGVDELLFPFLLLIRKL